MALNNDFQKFIHKSRYARWIDDENRREEWYETVLRYTDYVKGALKEHNGFEMTAELEETLISAISNTEVMPSMRGLMTAGPALERDSTCIYNCAYTTCDSLRSFDEAMFILMCGTGVGYSVEQKYVTQLPVVPKEFVRDDKVHVVGDSKQGWAVSLRYVFDELFSGRIPSWDTSGVRPAGARLKTFGGRASGPEPLEALLHFVVETVTGAAGRKLTDVECHDIYCKIADIVVVGGVRRSAMISLSDVTSTEMAKAKSGEWWNVAPHRRLANNSAVYDETPSWDVFSKEWDSLVASGSGERGIFSRKASRNLAKKSGRRDANYEFGTNPCSEIILRPQGFCNLTEVIVRPEDSLGDLMHKVEKATILGTFQSTFTRFSYLRDVWKKNAEEERLLGVSLTGQMGHKVLNGREGAEKLEFWLETLKNVAIETNKRYAKALGINQSAAITCVKPSGTVSQLVMVSSGMHTWHSDYYIRTVRQDNKDPMTQFMVDAGIPSEPDVMAPNNTTVFSFPIAAPAEALTRDSLTAIEHLELWLVYQRAWCEHKPSITITVKDDEWDEVGRWCFDHIDELSGVSFLPHSDHTYQQAPYQEIDEDAYIAAKRQMPKSIDWSLLSAYEFEDTTTGTQELACVANNCEVVGSAGDYEEEEFEETLIPSAQYV
jgi:ribonucleoside-triphosphate reductase